MNVDNEMKKKAYSSAVKLLRDEFDEKESVTYSNTALKYFVHTYFQENDSDESVFNNYRLYLESFSNDYHLSDIKDVSDMKTDEIVDGLVNGSIREKDVFYRAAVLRTLRAGCVIEDKVSLLVSAYWLYREGNVDRAKHLYQQAKNAMIKCPSIKIPAVFGDLFLEENPFAWDLAKALTDVSWAVFRADREKRIFSLEKTEFYKNVQNIEQNTALMQKYLEQNAEYRPSRALKDLWCGLPLVLIFYQWAYACRLNQSDQMNAYLKYLTNRLNNEHRLDCILFDAYKLENDEEKKTMIQQDRIRLRKMFDGIYGDKWLINHSSINEVLVSVNQNDGLAVKMCLKGVVNELTVAPQKNGNYLFLYSILWMNHQKYQMRDLLFTKIKSICETAVAKNNLNFNTYFYDKGIESFRLMLESDLPPEKQIMGAIGNICLFGSDNKPMPLTFLEAKKYYFYCMNSDIEIDEKVQKRFQYYLSTTYNADEVTADELPALADLGIQQAQDALDQVMDKIVVLDEDDELIKQNDEGDNEMIDFTELVFDSFHGFLTDEGKIETLARYLKILSNREEQDLSIPAGLFLSCDDHNLALRQADYILECINRTVSCEEYRLIAGNNLVDGQEDVLVIDAFDSSVNFRELLDYVESHEEQIVICLSNDKAEKAGSIDPNRFHRQFVKNITVEPYDTDQIVSAAKWIFNNTDDIEIEDEFYPALEKYIRNIYPRALYKDEQFVNDLPERLITKSLETDHPNVLAADCIPYYIESKSLDVCEQNLKEEFVFSSNIPSLLNKVRKNVKIKNMGLTHVHPCFNIIVTADDQQMIQRFASKYAEILYCNEYLVIPSVEVLTMTADEVIASDKNNMFAVRRGIVVVSGLENVEEDTVNAVFDVCDRTADQIVWIMSGNHVLDKVGEDTAEKARVVFANEIDLDKHTLETSIAFIRKYLSHKNDIELTESQLQKLQQIVNDQNSYLKAEIAIDQWISDLVQKEGEDTEEGSDNNDDSDNNNEGGSGTDTAVTQESAKQNESEEDKTDPDPEMVSGIITWDDAKRPESVNLKIQNINKETVKVLTVKPDENGVWKYSVTLPKQYRKNKRRNYKIVVDDIPEYEVSANVYNLTLKKEQKKPNNQEILENQFPHVLEDEENLHKIVSAVSVKDTSIKNVLLIPLSTLNKPAVGRYRYDDEPLQFSYYVGQLEPIPKILAEKLAKENQVIDAIIVMNTNATKKEDKENPIKVEDRPFNMSQFDFFKERCSCVFKDKDINRIEGIDLQDEQGNDTLEKTMYGILRKLERISENGAQINLHIATHGGMRSVSVVTNSIITLLKNNPHINSISRYASQWNKNYKCYNFFNVDEEFKIYDFVSGINEFLSFGRSASLETFVKSTNSESGRKITDAINRISDDISLCRMESFNEDLCALNTVLKAEQEVKEKSYFDFVNSIIRDDYCVQFNNKPYNLLEKDTQDLLAQITWCINKGFMQQALTLIESKLSDYLLEKKVYVLEKDSSNNTITETINSIMTTGIFNYTYYKNRSKYPRFGYFKKNYKAVLNDKEIQKITTPEKLRKYVDSITNPSYLKDYDNGRKYYDSDTLNRIASEKKIEVIDFLKQKDFNCAKRIPVNECCISYTEIGDEYLKDLYCIWYLESFLKLFRNDTNHAIGSQVNFTVTNLMSTIKLFLKMVSDIIDKTEEIKRKCEGETA